MKISAPPVGANAARKKFAARNTLVRVDERRWRREIPGVVRLCRETVAEVLARAPGTASEVSIMLTDDDTVRGLNRRYRRRDTATNVLSFALPRDSHDGLSPPLGDIVVAFETVCREARAQGKSIADHLRHLVAHGALHLLGHDHEGDAEAATMEQLEAEVLAVFGVGDPYTFVDDRGDSRDKRR